ncbi:MAG: DUF1036 domain-containing protein [Synergistaceae bacterium]|nr:DUF1036 domain-containing protein [Synergistaceae bacterium]
MRTTIKFLCLALAILVFSATAASAANFTFSNDLDLRIAITMTYYDAEGGALTTSGWWHVEPDSETVISVNADTSREVYYAAYNKVPYIDSATRNNARIDRWASPRTFTFTTDAEPDMDGVWLGRFYQISGGSVNIDGRP